MPETRLGRWLYSLISSSAPQETCDELIVALPSASAEPFTVVWYVMIALVERDREWASHCIADISSDVAAAVSLPESVAVSTVEELMRAVLGYRDATVPYCPVEDMLSMCVTLCVVLARGVALVEVEEMIRKAEWVTAREGINVP